MSDLTARQNLLVLLAVSEDLTSLKDILVNGVSIANQEIAFAFTKGGEDQAPISGFDRVVKDVTTDFPLLNESPITYIVNPSDGDTPTEVEVGVYFPNGVYYQKDNGSTSKSGVQITFYVGEGSSGSWAAVPKKYIKTMNHVATYRSTVLIKKPASIANGSIWRIRAVRDSTNSAELGTSDKSYHMNKTSVNFTTLTNTSGVSYAGTALLALHVEDISLINNRFPEITFQGKGMKFCVPSASHYNPSTKAYTGAWDGTLEATLQYTTNLSWIIYTILSDKLTKTIPINKAKTQHYTYQYSFGVAEEDLGLWSFYNFARYCDQTFLGFPRYELSKQFVEKIPRTRFLEVLLSLGNAKLVRKHGLVCIVYDRKLTEEELNSVPIFIPESTEKGFEESVIDSAEAFTHVTAAFEDLTNRNVVSTVQAESTELVTFLKALGWLSSEESSMYFIDKYGYNPTTIELAGASRYTSALVKARGILWDALVGNKFITFSGSYEFSSLYEGQVIGVINNSLSFVKKTGRLKSWTEDGLYTLVLDEEMSLAPSDAVYLMLKDPANFSSEKLSDDVQAELPFPAKVFLHTSNFEIGETSKVSDTWIFSLPYAPVDNTFFAKVEANKVFYTITNIDFEEDKHIVRAKIYQPEKFDFIAGAYDRKPLQQLFTSLPMVDSITPSVSVHEGLSSAQIFIEVVFSHTIPLTVAQKHTIKYNISCSFLDGTLQEQESVKTLARRSSDEIGLTSPESTTDALEVSQDHYVKFAFTFPNYKQYFLENDVLLASIEANLTIQIQASILRTGSSISPSGKAIFQDTVTLNKPTSSGSITVGT